MATELVERVAEAIHIARFPADRTPTPFAGEYADGQEYCRRLAEAALSALPQDGEVERDARERLCSFMAALKGTNHFDERRELWLQAIDDSQLESDLDTLFGPSAALSQERRDG